MICTAPAALACSRQALRPAAAKHYNQLQPSTLRGAHGRTRLVVLPMNPPARTTCELRRGAQGKGACARACEVVLDLQPLAACTRHASKPAVQVRRCYQAPSGAPPARAPWRAAPAAWLPARPQSASRPPWMLLPSPLRRFWCELSSGEIAFALEGPAGGHNPSKLQFEFALFES